VGATAVAGAGLGMAALLLGTPGIPRLPSGLARGSVERHLSNQVGFYRLPAQGAAAALGAASLVAPAKEPGRMRAAWLLLPWALVPLAAALVFATGRAVPVQRSLSFAVAIPLLGGLGGVALVHWLRGRLGAVAAAVGAVVVAGALLASVFLGWEAWRTRRPWSEDRRLAEFQALGGYLAGAGRPAIIVVDRPEVATEASGPHFGTVPVMRRVRAELPPRLALQTTVYLGDPDLLLAGRPTLRPGLTGFDEVSREMWRAVRPLLEHDPIIVVLRSQFLGFDEAARAHPGWREGPWAAIVAGPPVPAGFDRPAPPERPSAGSLTARWAISFAVISFAGIGWAGRFGGGPPSLRIALAPATGVAILVAAGLLAERFGVRIGGPGGVVVWIAVAFAGAVAAVTARPGALA
jgi:hypothetical protein